MLQHIKRPAGLLLLASSFSTPTAYAQIATEVSQAAPSNKSARLRKEVNELKQKLATLEEKLALEEKKKDEELAAEEERQEQRATEQERETQSQAENGTGEAVAGTGLSTRVDQRPPERMLVPNMLADQKAFWTRPARIRANDVNWFLPFVGASSLLIGSDTSIEKKLPSSPTIIRRSQDFSSLGLGSLVGAAGTLYLWGSLAHNDHKRETGFLSGEALANSLLNSSIIKVAAGRDRPTDGNGKGQFWQGGSSFPSDHAAAAWSVASVVAHEYPGPLTKILAYGTASAISLARVTGRKHFASDVFIGSSLGWYLGREVYRAHHNPELGGEGWGELVENKPESPRNPENMGSPYVPLDSWVYPALERLAALGYIQSAYLGMRPWTRMECARLLEEVGDDSRYSSESQNETLQLLSRLATEFGDESSRRGGASNIGIGLDSIYTRVTNISNSPLRDGFHLGQTLINDYGRPYAEGFNNVTGLSAFAVAGPLSLFFRGEYQKTPRTTPYPASVLQAIDGFEDSTSPLSNGTPDINRFRLLDSAVALTVKNFQISFGKQSLWLGPGTGGPFLFSDNAEPIPMLRIDQISAVYIPGISRVLGMMRSEFGLGRLSGQHWIFSGGRLFGPNISDQPFLHVEKISFKPTSNFEFGMGISAVFGGPGIPITWRNFFNTFTILGNSTALPGTRQDPGDRRSTADFTYRLPHLRNWVTLYGDSLVEDEVSPIGSSRPSLRLGLYLPKVPELPKLDLRMESVYTDAPHTVFVGNVYDNGRFRSGYTNFGQIMGSWIGRAGKGGQGWATYWFSPQSTLQLMYRRQQVDAKFLKGGGLNDFGIKGEYSPRSQLSLQGFIQYETWKFPILSPRTESDVTVSLQLTFYPHWNSEIAGH